MKKNISNIWIGIFKVSNTHITLSVKILYIFVSIKFINILIKSTVNHLNETVESSTWLISKTSLI